MPAEQSLSHSVPSYFEGGQYDVIVISWSHAGCEAAAAIARLGASVILFGMN